MRVSNASDFQRNLQHNPIEQVVKVSKDGIQQSVKASEKGVKDIRASIEARNARSQGGAQAKESEGVEEVKGEMEPAKNGEGFS